MVMTIMYSLVEIFESLQGEGRNTGRPCIFIRFAGCNFNCPWCDTDWKTAFTITLPDLMNEIKTYRVKNVIITGGEPTLVKDIAALIAQLKANNYWIGVETNGSTSRYEAEWLNQVDYVACSPKTEYADRLRLEYADEVRVVASSEQTLAFCRTLPAKIKATDYYISPCDFNGKIDFATAKYVLSQLDGWSLSVQLHKILGFK